MNMRWLILAVALRAAAASAQTPDSVTVLVPIVGSVTGANDVRWKTDVELHNDSRQEAFVALRLPTAPNRPAIAFTIPPGGTQNFTDIVSQAFSMEEALSPLTVETLGKRSVRVVANVYGVRGTQVTRPQPIPISYGEPVFPVRTLNGLSFSDAFRTNIGLVNLGEQEASFTLALQRLADRNIAVTRVALPPNSLWHMSIQSLFPLITKGDDFAVVIETAAPATYAYASVVDNTSNEARFINPTAGSATGPLMARDVR